MVKMEFKELVDIESLKRMAESLFEASGIPVGIIDTHGTIHVQAGWQNICTKYHRVHPHTCNRCLESDRYITGNLHEGLYKEYKCLNGMWDIGVPLIIEDNHIATIFLGQFFYEDEEIDMEFYRRQAIEFGFDEIGYMEALAAVPRFPRKKVRHIIEYYLDLVRTLAQNGLSEIKLRRSQEALFLSQRFMNTIYNSVNESIFIHDFHGKIIDVNKRASVMFGYDLNELVHLNLNDIISINSPIRGERLYEVLETARHVYPVVLECICVNKLGKEFWVEVNLSSVKLEENEEIIATVRDITDRKLDELAAYREALEMENLRTEFFANISHELRTPLNIIFGVIQIMERELAKTDKAIDRAKLEGNLGIGRQNCYRLLRLINNLIDSTKLDAGYFELHRTNCNIVSIIEDMTQSVAEYIRSNNMSLTFDTDIEEKIIGCDLDKLERIMLNLLSNAVKFSSAGGSVNVSITDGDEYVTISVEDNGIGIPSNKLDVIFDRFRQVDKSLARNHEGSGIGLSLVKSLVELHGGSVTVESNYGHGTKFIVKLPVIMVEEYMDEIACSMDCSDGSCIERIKIEFSDIYQ